VAFKGEVRSKKRRRAMCLLPRY